MTATGESGTELRGSSEAFRRTELQQSDKRADAMRFALRLVVSRRVSFRFECRCKAVDWVLYTCSVASQSFAGRRRNSRSTGAELNARRQTDRRSGRQLQSHVGRVAAAERWNWSWRQWGLEWTEWCANSACDSLVMCAAANPFNSCKKRSSTTARNACR